MSEDKHICNNCNKDFEELVTREGFVQTYFCEFVCKGCFLELEGISFEDYDSDYHYYGAKSE